MYPSSCFNLFSSVCFCPTTGPRQLIDQQPSMSTLQPQIRTYHTHLPSPLPQSPSFQFHVTRLTDTLFIWVGAAVPSAVSLQEARLKAASGAESSGTPVGDRAGDGDANGNGSGSGLAGLVLDDDEPRGEAEKRVTVDWAVSMPVRAVRL
jgi:hypothetical protein